ncbi:MAG: hypothetical protein PHY27_03400 [Parabacteroides sp.]|nr:hypothetical protein [Parabacteroides sp.]
MSDKMAADYTVLIVDDVPTNVMLVQAILKKEGKGEPAAVHPYFFISEPSGSM